MFTVKRAVAATGILATAGFGSFMGVTAASATTHKCAVNPYCYTQEVTGTPLEMAGSVPWNNSPVTVTKIDTLKNAGTDFLDGQAAFPIPSHSSYNPKFFEYAPYGKPTGRCVTEPKKGAQLVLQRCDNSLNQTWDAHQIGSANSYSWVNEATGDYMTAGAHGSSGPIKDGTKLTGAKHVSGAKNQAWTATDGS
jgi:hypothetical protein